MLLYLLQTIVLFSVTEPSAWARIQDRGDGFIVERRDIPGTRFPEFRITAESTGEPRAVLERAWNGREGAVETKLRKERRVLSENATTRLIYETIRTPIVTDRDYVMYFVRRSDETTNQHSVGFWTRRDAGPPPQPGYVRVRYVRGSWDLRPNANGGTNIVYTCVMDPGGDLPVWLTLGAQTQLAVDMVTELVRDTKSARSVQASVRSRAAVVPQ